MDRSEEFLKICQIHNSEIVITSNDSSSSHLAGSKGQLDVSQFMQQALHVAQTADSNDTLIKRMEALAVRKEFSNDPSQEMADLTDLFQKKISIIKKSMDSLKRMAQENIARPV